jgi:hypothetical protein
MVKPRNTFQTRNLVSFITIYYLAVPVQLISSILTPLYLLSTMCPFLSSCSRQSLWTLSPDDIPESPFYASELGCSSSRCWAEINDKFGEPVGSVRRVQRWGLGAERELLACSLRMVYSVGEEDTEDGCEEEVSWKEENPGAVLDISMKKQQQVTAENLYKKVLVDNTVNSVQGEINMKIIESFLFF